MYLRELNTTSSSNIRSDDYIKQLKAELAELLEEDAAYDKLRCLPLFV
jgi:hypothetical protein